MRVGTVAIAAGVLAAAGLAGHGIRSRGHGVTALQLRADDASVPRVGAASPMPAAAKATLTPPGQVPAWNEAQIYGQVSGSIGHRYADDGAHVKAGDVPATIDTPRASTRKTRPASRSSRSPRPPPTSPSRPRTASTP